MLDRVIGEIGQKPDIFVQVSVANEFDSKGHLELGYDADMVICDDDFNVKETYILGRRVYES